MPEVARYPDSYASSRDRFRELADAQARWWREFPLPADVGATVTQSLTIDVAYLGPEHPDRLVLVTSGLHGVEGFFGAAVQHRLLQQLANANEQPVGLLLVHALNPFGFANRRRWNEANIDLNRNFLLPDEAYAGVPPRYADMNRLLNPTRAPRSADPFLWLAAGKIARFGLSALQQAIAGGQYEYPQWLFFGGKEPSATQVLLLEHLHNWVQGAEQIVHLDFHTGLGPWATHKLLIEEPADSPGAQSLSAIYGKQLVCSPYDNKSAYHTRGGIGSWCKHHLGNRRYSYACAEFGTYGPLKVLAGLRKENQAYWYTPPDSAARRVAADRLQELFCPASCEWRARVLSDGVKLVTQALTTLAKAGQGSGRPLA